MDPTHQKLKTLDPTQPSAAEPGGTTDPSRRLCTQPMDNSGLYSVIRVRATVTSPWYWANYTRCRSIAVSAMQGVLSTALTANTNTAAVCLYSHLRGFFSFLWTDISVNWSVSNEDCSIFGKQLDVGLSSCVTVSDLQGDGGEADNLRKKV